jgi:Mn-dependent DtxR family transcriptional regulator
MHALFAVMRDAYFRSRDLEEFGAISREEAQSAIRELQRMQMIRRQPRGSIRIEPELLSLLRKLRQEIE